MADLAGEERVARIFSRCPGHPWVDDKFGQIGGDGNLAEERPRYDRKTDGRIHQRPPTYRPHREIRLWPRHPRPHYLAMPTFEVLPPLTATAVLPGRLQQKPCRPRRPTLPRS
ncbi:hypothetical protein ABT063_04425 [Streptomyces sp. NPDC002838]|uniref:hypothetical protein n=1 Tax=Streptomyces sp. NPDC002838 TaxID=3154436 RepID=UPI00332598C0